VTTRVLGVGAAAPSWRLPATAVDEAWGRSGGSSAVAAVCAPDEDVLTIAWDAATAALEAAGVDAEHVDGLWWGTSRPPFAEGPSHAFLAASLGLAPHCAGALLSGSTHSGIEALLAGSDAVAAGTARVALVVASDALRPGLGTSAEARTGSGAAAFVLGAEGGAASLVARVTRSRPLVDRYRGDGEHATRDLYDNRLFREEIFLPVTTEVGGALASFSPRAWSLPDPDGRIGRVLSRRLGADTVASTPVYALAGDTGAAAPLLGAAAALDAAGVVAVLAYGGGRCTGVTIDADGPVPGSTAVMRALDGGRTVSYPDVLRAREQLVASGETVPMGVPPESALFARGASEMLGALGGRCADCGTISTPPSVHPTCTACGGEKLEAVSLARDGEVHTFVVNQTMPPPFVAPLPMVVVDLDDGARVMLQGVGPGDDFEIGRRVRLVLRRYAHERGVPVYGFKARAVQTVAGT
jgi:hydroxymethylglutaryl-CoA synthase